MFNLVIARFNENVSWVKESCIWEHMNRVYIYNKGDTPIDGLDTCTNVVVRNLPNVGREGHTYYTHIVMNYTQQKTKEDLYTIFIQADPFPHAHNCIDNITHFVEHVMIHSHYRPLFVPIGETLLLANINNPDHQGLPLKHAFKLLFNHDYKGNIPFVAGALFAVSPKAIASRPIEYYEGLVDFLSLSKDPIEGYIIERFHYPIFVWSEFYTTYVHPFSVITNKTKKKKERNAHRGARTHDHMVKSHALYQLS